MNQQNHREQEGSVKTGRGTLYRVAWAVVFGLLGFFVNFQDIQLLAGPAFKISILAGLFFPLVIALAWGWRYGLLAALAGGCQSMWWLWRTDGWGLFYAVPVFTLWMVWHGWWADRRRVKTAWYTSPFIVEIPFRIVVELGFYTIFRWLVSFNPPPWNPAVSWAHVSLVWVNTVVIKHVVTGYILLLAAYVTLNLGGVRRFFRLPRRAGQHDVTAIYATALLAGFLFWLVDAFMAWTVFNDQAVSFWEQAVIHVKPRCMGIRVLVFVFAVAGATVFARLAYVRAGLTQRLDHLNRVLAAIRDVNQLITHEKNHDRLLEEACRLLVHTRGFFSAWLAVVDSSGSVQKTFQSGFEGRFSSMEEALSMSVLPDCARTALKEPGVHVMDPARQCLGCSLSDEYDGRAALTMQLVHEGRVYGFVSVAVPPPYAWDKQEHELFAEVCNDLAYALWSLEVDAARGLLEEKYAAVLDSTSDAVMATDLEGRIMLFNAGAERLLECSASEVLGTSIRLFCPEELGDEQSRMLQELLTSGQVQRIETQRVTAKGRLIPVEISLDVRVDEHGKPAGYTGILRDISERKRIEALAQQSQRRYRVIFEGSRDGIVMVDALGHFLDANQAYCDMLGYSLEELRALKDFYSITPERWRQWEAEEIVAKRLLEQGYSDVYEKEYIRKDGSVFPVELQSYTVRDADGGVEYLWGIARDITARQTAETALRESEERMDLILRSAELGTWDWNVQTGEVVFNERWAAMLGYELEEIAPHADSWAALVHPDDMPHVQEVLQAHLRGESDVYETEHRMKHKSGRWVWVLDKGAVIERNEAGEPIRACGTHLDITQRKRMEEQQRLHSLVLSQIADFVTVTDLEGNITYVNDAVCRILGHTRDELVGKPLAIYANPCDGGVTQNEILDRTLQGGWRGEVVNETADGDSIFLDCRTRQVLDELGNMVALCGISTDITERKKVEEALAKSRALLNEVEHIAGIGGWEMNLETREAAWTQGTYEVCELSSDEPAPGPDEHVNWYLPDYRALVVEEIRALIEEDKPLEYEAQFRTVKGNIRWGRAVGRAERRDGKCVRIYGTFQDVTERKEAEEALLESEQRFREYINSAPNGVFVADENGNYIDVNPAAEQVTGYSRKELLDMNLVDLIAPEMRFEARENFQELKRRGRSRAHDICFVRKDGDRRFWVVNSVKLSDTRFLGFVADTTERKEQEEILKAAKEAAEAAARAKSAFLANMSHELRTPLNPIMGFTDLVLADADLSDEHRSFLTMVKQRSRDLLQLLSDILDIAKVEANRVVIRPEAVNLREVIRDVLAMFEHEVAGKGITLESRMAPELPEGLMLDPARLRQVLLNLVGNAVKFTEQGGITVMIEWFAPCPDGPEGTGRLVLKVNDTGCGIAPEYQAVIFDSFEQADNSSTRQYGGAGLGLAICKRLVELMQGTITLASTPGRGSSFTVSLCVEPVSSPVDEAPGANPRAEVTEEPFRRLRVLLVEDDEASTTLTKRILEREGHGIFCVNSGGAAVEQGGEKGYDLIMMDVKLPGMDGLEATRRLREQGCTTPIVAMTACAFEEDRQACLDAGMDAWMTKPVNLQKVKAMISNVI